MVVPIHFSKTQLILGGEWLNSQGHGFRVCLDLHPELTSHQFTNRGIYHASHSNLNSKYMISRPISTPSYIYTYIYIYLMISLWLKGSAPIMLMIHNILQIVYRLREARDTQLDTARDHVIGLLEREAASKQKHWESKSARHAAKEIKKLPKK